MSSNPPLVSVIIPNYNHAPFLPERLNSILGQTVQDFELIILDDASTDNSIQVIKEHLSGYSYRLFINSLNSGSPCSQWLKGINLANGKYIWIAESDDSCDDSFLQQMLNAMEQGHCLSYCRTASIDEHGELAPENPYWPDCIDPNRWGATFIADTIDFNKRFMTSANCIPNASSVVFRRDRALTCLNVSNLLSKVLRVGDWIFWHHYLCIGTGSLFFKNEPLCYFRYHPSTTRAASTRRSELRRLHEYSNAVDHILSHSGSAFAWIRVAMDGGWDWILKEYISRYRPTFFERVLTRGLHGRLAWSVALRLLRSKTMRNFYFSQEFHQLRLRSAQCKQLLKNLLMPSRANLSSKGTQKH
jgi:glycosyltransferase involved in cell wall biosynthesis